MRNATSSETCTACAECCKHYPFVELSKTDIAALEKFTGLKLDVFTNPKGKAVEEYFLQFKDNGDCIFLNGQDNKYSCSVYEARSGICRTYPSTPIQKEACRANRSSCLKPDSGQHTVPRQSFLRP